MASGPRAYASAGRVRLAASRSGQPATDRWRTRRRAGVRAAPWCVDRRFRAGGQRRPGRGRVRGPGEAKAKHYDVVIVDTAGRLGIDDELMSQAAAIREAVDPDEVIFVLDAMIGQDAVTTAEAFREGVGFTGVVLTKLDGDARGGAARAVRGGA